MVFCALTPVSACETPILLALYSVYLLLIWSVLNRKSPSSSFDMPRILAMFNVKEVSVIIVCAYCRTNTLNEYNMKYNKAPAICISNRATKA